MITYAVNGIGLDDAAGRWKLMKGSSIAPGLSAEQVSIKVPGVDGVFPVAFESRQAPPLSLRIKVQGTSDGTLRDNLVSLLMALTPSRGGVTVGRSVDGVLTYAAAKMETISEPEYSPARLTATVTVVYRLTAGCWRQDAADWSQAGVTSGTAYEVSTLAGSSALITDARILVPGPVTNPKIMDVASGAWALVTATIAAGSAVLLNCANWAVYQGAATLSGGGTGATGLLTTSGGPYMLALTPEVTATDPAVRRVRLSVTGTGFGAGTGLSVRAAKAIAA